MDFNQQKRPRSQIDPKNSPKNKTQNSTSFLPKIQQSSLKLQQEKQSQQSSNLPKLPLVRADQNVAPTQQMPSFTDRKIINDSQTGDFVGQIEKQLKMIIEEHNIAQIEQSSGSDDDFQSKIHQNKKLIKEAKLKKNQDIRETRVKENQSKNTVNKKENKGKKSLKGNLYQKKIKEYKDGNMENKFLAKKKQILKKQKDIRITDIPKEIDNPLLKHTQSKEEITKISKFQTKNSQNLNQNSLSRNNKIYSQKKQLKKQASNRLIPIHKNQDLFDSIQNYLQNPQKLQKEQNSYNFAKQKSSLQEKLMRFQLKLKNIQQKDPVNEYKSIKENELKIKLDKKIYRTTISEWSKVDIKEKQFDQQPSSFDKEIERINKYAQRNEKSIQKYLVNQKALVDIHFSKKSKSREKHHTQKSSV